MADEIQTEAAQAPEAAGSKKPKSNPFSELEKTMYNRSLSKEEVDLILQNKETVHLVYHSVSGGINFFDSMNDNVIFSLNDKGNITHTSTAVLKDILDNIPAYSKFIYDLFQDGLLTMIDYESFHGAVDNVASQIYAEAFKGQRSLHSMSNGIFTGFASNDNKNDLNEGTI